MTATNENIQELVAEIQKTLLARGEMLATAAYRLRDRERGRQFRRICGRHRRLPKLGQA